MKIGGLKPQPTHTPGSAESRSVANGGRTTTAAPTDLRDLSPQAQLFLMARRAALQTMTERAQRVASLQEQIAAGTYPIDATKLCDALIRQLTQWGERSS